ncbi:hypothetical protein [Oceanobacillus timonensis]|uniref:hypothetical protein n=1 Tax=Oceanobacillus timonensis TaxID=1926285 RepID=UPI0009BC6524|nr:hypothetical protein [Oceanobacillus timonensis]
MTFLTLFIVILLIILPIISYFLFSFNKENKLQLRSYYLIEAIIILLLTGTGHIYYYQVYNLNFLPNTELNTIIFASLGASMLLYIFDSIYSRIKKRQKLPIQWIAIFFIIMLIFLTWMIPLGYKYFYADRLEIKEEIFTNKDTEKIIIDSDKNIMVGLIDSSYDPFIRPRSGRTYSNYFYIKNNGSTPYNGDIHLILFNEDKEHIDAKLFENVNIDPHSDQLLVEKRENSFKNSVWNERSFNTKQKIDTFDAVISKSKSNDL